MAKWIGKWDGGRIAASPDGDVYYIERMRSGVRYGLSLGACTPKHAVGELALFERDPAAYALAREDAARPAEVEDAAVVTGKLVLAFAADLKERGRNKRHIRSTLAYLAQWVDALLVGRDLRKVTLGELHRQLDEWGTARPHRVRSLKAFTSFLRSRGHLRTADDPTIDLQSIQGRTPSAKERADKTHSVAQLEVTYRNLESQVHRDAFRVRLLSGMHITETERIAAGDCAINEVPDGGQIAGTVVFTHKSGKAHVQSLDKAALSACRRLMAHGTIQSIRNKHLAAAAEQHNRACRDEAERIEPVRLGNLRHTFVTLAARVGTVVHPPTGGVEHSMIAQLVGHSGTRTMGRHYLGEHVPPMIALPLRLLHPDDPA